MTIVRVELHCHSTASDGSLAPTHVAQAAVTAGVKWFALTDHDTLAGVDEAMKVLPADVLAIPACEVTVRYFGYTLHILTYVPTSQARLALETELHLIRQARAERVIAIAHRLGKMGKPIDLEPLLSQATVRPLGRPDLARALVKAGHCRDTKQAFTRFLRDKGPADVPASVWDIGQLVRLAEREGLLLVLAHPHTVGTFEVVRELFATFGPQGLRGIEGFYGPYAMAQRQPWLDLSQRMDLIALGGSDFHGEMKPEVTRPGVDIPTPWVERVVEWFHAAGFAGAVA